MEGNPLASFGEPGAAVAEPVTNAPNAPIISTYGSTVTISSDESGTTYYTTDGRDPTPASTEYTGPIDLGIGKLMVKAVCIRNGVGSSIATSYYSYTPRSLAISPDGGQYEIQVHVTISSDHHEVRYTLDGSVPTADSVLYSSPIPIVDEGTTTVTAAMFSNGSLIGDVARRRYVITEAKLVKPTILPLSGTYEAPLRISLSGAGKILFTLNGDDPNGESQVYTNPIIVPAPCHEIVVKAIVYHETNPSLSSIPSEAKYEVVASNAVEDGRTEHALPAQNLEFDRTNETHARAKAEEVMAWLLAAVEYKEQKTLAVERLKQKVVSEKAEYSNKQKRLASLQQEVSIANARRAQLESQRSGFVSAAQRDIDSQLEKLRNENEQLIHKKKALDVQLQEGEALHAQTVEEKKTHTAAAESLKSSMHDKYLQNKKELCEQDPHLFEDLEGSRMIIAEQRHELALLRATEKAIKQPAASENSGFVQFAPPKRLVEVEIVETIVPIPVGMMRLVTTVNGGGLQRLRKNHSVDACIVTTDGGLAVKVVGHSRGVHRFVQELEGILNTTSQ